MAQPERRRMKKSDGSIGRLGKFISFADKFFIMTVCVLGLSCALVLISFLLMVVYPKESPEPETVQTELMDGQRE